MKYRILSDDKSIDYVYDANYDLNPDCAYKLSELVEISCPGLWSILKQHCNVRQLGKQFHEAVLSGKFPGLRPYHCKTSDGHYLYKMND